MQYDVNLKSWMEQVDYQNRPISDLQRLQLQVAIAERLEALVVELKKINDSLSILALRK